MRIVKLSISLVCFSLDSVRRFGLRLLGRRPDATCVIIYYHSVPEEHRAAFAHQLDLIKQLSKPLAVDPAPVLQAGKRYCCVTFDDGFEDTIQVAIPELKKRKIPATVFVASGYMGQAATWWPTGREESEVRIASAEQWRAAAGDLITIGSHTVTHPRLSDLGDLEAMDELRNSKIVLQEIVQRTVSTFSFPYGSFSERSIGLCRKAGYGRVFTTLPGYAFADGDQFVVGRINASPTDWDVELCLKLLGAYRWLPVAFRWKRKLLRPATRREPNV